MDELKVLGKSIMNASVEADLLGLRTVGTYLTMAFEEVTHMAADLRAEGAGVEEEGTRVKGEGLGDGC